MPGAASTAIPPGTRILVRDRRDKDMRGKGVGLVTHFVKALLARDVPIHLGVEVDRLTVEGGRVTGVRSPTAHRCRREKGVVLATGGYEWNAELMRDFDPIPRLQPLSPPSSTGDGLIMGAEIGAAIRRIQNNLSVMLGFHLVPDEPGREPIQCMAGISEMCSPHTVVVNKAGKRFADESYFQSVVPALRKFDTLKHDYANLPCFLIFDRQFAASYSLAHLPVGTAVPASVARADTMPELGAGSVSTPAALERTVERFNDSPQTASTRTSSAGRCAGGSPTVRRSGDEIQPRRARSAAVLRPRVAPEPGQHVGRAAGECQRAGRAPAAAPDPRPLRVRRGGGAHRARRRLSSRAQPRLGDDVQLSRRAAHGAREERQIDAAIHSGAQRAHRMMGFGCSLWVVGERTTASKAGVDWDPSCAQTYAPRQRSARLQ